jgi:hypothetical protein
MAESGLVKVSVRLESDPEYLSEDAWAEEETLWARPLGGDLFEIRNIPWETDALHFLDVVRGRPRATDIWDVLEVVSRSGHSTIRLTFSESASRDQRDEVIKRPGQLVGNAEHMAGDHWAVDVNPGVDVEVALALLAKHEQAGVIARSAHT